MSSLALNLSIVGASKQGASTNKNAQKGRFGHRIFTPIKKAANAIKELVLRFFAWLKSLFKKSKKKELTPTTDNPTVSTPNTPNTPTSPPTPEISDEKSRNRAASTIQRTFRKYKIEKAKNSAALTIQTAFRKHLQIKELEKQETEAAVASESVFTSAEGASVSSAPTVAIDESHEVLSPNKEVEVALSEDSSTRENLFQSLPISGELEEFNGHEPVATVEPSEPKKETQKSNVFVKNASTIGNVIGVAATAAQLTGVVSSETAGAVKSVAKLGSNAVVVGDKLSSGKAAEAGNLVLGLAAKAAIVCTLPQAAAAYAQYQAVNKATEVATHVVSYAWDYFSPPAPSVEGGKLAVVSEEPGVEDTTRDPIAVVLVENSETNATQAA